MEDEPIFTRSVFSDVKSVWYDFDRNYPPSDITASQVGNERRVYLRCKDDARLYVFDVTITSRMTFPSHRIWVYAHVENTDVNCQLEMRYRTTDPFEGLTSVAIFPCAPEWRPWEEEKR